MLLTLADRRGVLAFLFLKVALEVDTRGVVWHSTGLCGVAMIAASLAEFGLTGAVPAGDTIGLKVPRWAFLFVKAGMLTPLR